MPVRIEILSQGGLVMSPSLPEQLRRPSLRYPSFDYAACGAYFVTICAFRGLPLFGHIEQQAIIANPIGKLVLDCWRQIPDHHDGVVLDEAMLMPNHFHGVL
jgi:REP element-mobilizing transposase RayT